MSHYITTYVRSSNPNVISACASALRNFDKQMSIDWTDGVAEICVSLNKYLPYREIEEVSKRFPDDVLIFAYDDEWHYSLMNYDGEDPTNCIYVSELRNGESIPVEIEPDYFFRMPSGINKDQDLICDKVVAFCRKLDMTESDKDGAKFFQWFDEAVVYKFEYDSKDGKKYRVEATKRKWVIEVKIYDYLSKDEGPEITDSEMSNNECGYVMLFNRFTNYVCESDRSGQYPDKGFGGYNTEGYYR